MSDIDTKGAFEKKVKMIGGMPADLYYAGVQADADVRQAEKDRDFDAHRARVAAQQEEKDRLFAVHDAHVARQVAEKHRLLDVHDAAEKNRVIHTKNLKNDLRPR